ncbi:hypothetical protein ACJJTC_018246 [Scirpophaga incertulas]
MAPHTGSATPEQIDTLLNFLDEHSCREIEEYRRQSAGKEAVGRIVQYTEFYGWLHKNSSAVAKASQQQRRRRSAAGSDVRSRLFQVEEERAEREILQNRELAGIRSQLAGIKAELSQMSGLIREYLNNKNK